ncbi:MAG: AMP-dependent synthetase [Ruminococcaceae bacterium]|nr:AMP-dependent synthetase [Oscillospiraceae bacterium]
MAKFKVTPLNEVSKIERIVDIITQAEAECPDKIAYKYKNSKQEIIEVSYKTFGEDVRALGSALSALGVDKEHIAIVAENSYNWINVYLSVLCSRGVYLPVDKELPPDDMLYVLNNGDAKVLFYSKRFEKLFHEKRDELAGVQYFIGFDREEDEGEFLSFARLMEKGRKLLAEGYTEYTSNMASSDLEALKMLVYTSGTTGIAKGVMLSEKNLVCEVYHGLQVADILTVGLSVLPYHHTYEAVVGILVYLHRHAVTCINDSLAAILKNLKTYQPDFIYLVPAFLEMFYKKIRANMEEKGKWETFQKGAKISKLLLKMGIDVRRKLFKELHEVFGGNLRLMVVGAAPLRSEVINFFETVGITVCQGYGITECSPLVSVNRNNKYADPETVGMPLPCLEVRIDNPTEDGTGEICVKGKTVMLGYYKNEEETNRVMVDGWFHTGDLGKIDERGYLSITGRCKNLIVLDNGKNVYPEEIENYIMLIPYVAEVIVKGVKDENEKTVLLAEVFLNKDKVKEMEKAPDEARLLADIRKQTESLPMYKQVTKVQIRATEFEKTTTKKIRRV